MYAGARMQILEVALDVPITTGATNVFAKLVVAFFVPVNRKENRKQIAVHKVCDVSGEQCPISRDEIVGARPSCCCFSLGSRHDAFVGFST